MAEPKDEGTMEEGCAEMNRDKKVVPDSVFHGPTLREMLEDPRWGEPILLVGPMPDGGITPEFVESMLRQVVEPTDPGVCGWHDEKGNVLSDPLPNCLEPTQPDPWAGRNQHMRCITCMYVARKTAKVGRCRRHAPTMSGYPVVYIHDDWCGDHKLNEEAL